jgi:hypothetical protein
LSLSSWTQGQLRAEVYEPMRAYDKARLMGFDR